MTTPTAARRLMIIVNEDAMAGHRPLYSEIVHRALAAGLAGASVFRGIEGFGSSGRINTRRILSLAEQLPAMIVVIDSHDAINRFLPQLEELGMRGIVALDDVELAHPGAIPTIVNK